MDRCAQKGVNDEKSCFSSRNSRDIRRDNHSGHCPRRSTGRFRSGPCGGLIAGALIGGLASNAYGYGPGYGYYGGYAPAYYDGYAPAYYGGYAPAYYGGYAPAYYGYRYRRVYRPAYYGGPRYYAGWHRGWRHRW